MASDASASPLVSPAQLQFVGKAELVATVMLSTEHHQALQATRTKSTTGTQRPAGGSGCAS